jgi:hypothetical protein
MNIKLTEKEFDVIGERCCKVYELPGFTVTVKDTAEWAGKVAAECVIAQRLKIREWLEENSWNTGHALTSFETADFDALMKELE